MDVKEQFKIFRQVLLKFQAQGILQDIMLIGSWCLYFYQIEFDKSAQIQRVRTMDLDFLVPANKKISKEVDVPEILKQMGFIPTFNRSTGLVVYDHPDLRVEFLIPELGRGSDKPKTIEKLNIKAQSLRYLNLLMDYPRIISDDELHVKVPEPAIYALHKLIVSSRRKDAVKRDKDLEAATNLLDFLFTRPNEVSRIKSILRTLPKKWVKTILSVSEKHFPRLNETAKDM